MALRKLAEAREQSGGGDALHLSFDSEMLKLSIGTSLLAVPARGATWPTGFFIPVTQVVRLPQRLSSGRAEIGVWEGKLTIGNRVYGGITPDEPGSAVAIPHARVREKRGVVVVGSLRGASAAPTPLATRSHRLGPELLKKAP